MKSNKPHMPDDVKEAVRRVLRGCEIAGDKALVRGYMAAQQKIMCPAPQTTATKAPYHDFLDRVTVHGLEPARVEVDG